MILVIVSVLGCVQIPMDLRRRLLSRQATFLATMAIAVVIGAAAIVNGDLTSAALSLGAAVLMASVYALLHRLSPKSLGLGDVLLVVPLTLAVAHVALHRVLWWQLLASTSGAVHAIWVRKRSGQAGIPFGPNLLVAAWLVLLASV